jgi:hypothetical protein
MGSWTKRTASGAELAGLSGPEKEAPGVRSWSGGSCLRVRGSLPPRGAEARGRGAGEAARQTGWPVKRGPFGGLVERRKECRTKPRAGEGRCRSLWRVCARAEPARGGERADGRSRTSVRGGAFGRDEVGAGRSYGIRWSAAEAAAAMSRTRPGGQRQVGNGHREVTRLSERGRL